MPTNAISDGSQNIFRSSTPNIEKNRGGSCRNFAPKENVENFPQNLMMSYSLMKSWIAEEYVVF